MRRASIFMTALAASAWLAAPLAGWNSFGHMVVTSVAYRNLDAQTRARVDKLLQLNPYYKSSWTKAIPPGTASATRKRMIFMLAATWPDAIKRDSSYHNDGSQGGDRPDGPEAARNTGYDDFNRHKYWHFVDRPFSQDGTDTTSVEVPTPDAETQIAAFRTVLQSADQSDSLKSYDLVWLLHLVGDIHQPLHCATRVSSADPQGDAGGNDVKFCGPKATKCTGELHSYWDGLLGTSNAVASADTYAAGLDQLPAAAEDASIWIDASFLLARNFVYSDPVAAGDGPFQSTKKYEDAARLLARNEASLAGARLAEILKSGLK
jgi:S1/P1 Nuclease